MLPAEGTLQTREPRMLPDGASVAVVLTAGLQTACAVSKGELLTLIGIATRNALFYGFSV